MSSKVIKGIDLVANVTDTVAMLNPAFGKF